MPRRKMIGYIASLFALALFTLTDVVAEEYAPKPITQTDRCPVCGMYPSKYPKWHSQIVFRDGEHSSFDSPIEMFRFIHNMTKYDKRHTQNDIGMIYVPDYERGGWLDARLAFFVLGSKVDGPMGDDLPAFASKDDASAFTQKSGGEVLTFQQVTASMVIGMHGH